MSTRAQTFAPLGIDQPAFEFALLEEVRDRVTGFQGVITGRTEWAYGCQRYSVQPKGLKNGRPIEAMGFDEAALVRVKRAPKARKKAAPSKRKKGGPHAEPTRARTHAPG